MMTEGIWGAIINAFGGIVSAIIGLFKKSDKTESSDKSTINQTFNVKGNHNTVIGIQNDRKGK